MGVTLTKLLQSSLSQSSLRTYQRSWKLVEQFTHAILGKKPELPLSSQSLALFIAYLARKGYAASTALTFVSVIGYVHRISSLPDPTKTDMIRLALRGYSKSKPSTDIRLPITLPILERILSAFDHTSYSNFQRHLFRAMCTIAFFAALRVGEITTIPGRSLQNLIQFDQIAFLRGASGSVTGIKLTMKFFKHSNPSKPVVIFIYTDKPVCPVSTLIQYLSLRGFANGPLFCWSDNSAISRHYFTSTLNAALNFCGLDSHRYKSHSFRIGAASWAATKGLSDTQIREFGRWKSNAFLQYIRTPSLSLS